MSTKLSRRAFLRGSAVATATSTLGVVAASVATSAPSEAPPGIGPGPLPVDLDINGTTRTLLLEPRTTLADALRGPAGLTGTKVACDRGACSACTVWIDGEPVSSCMVLAIEARGHRITTIEGLAQGDVLHPVQAAFIEHDALQCGFCTPGMVMSCAALLEKTPAPSASDVEAAISGHLCRCGTYPHVVAATLAAAQARKG